MKISNVSFGSLMATHIKDGKPKASITDLLKLSFQNNPKLKNYNLQEDVVQYNEVIDGTIHNANLYFAANLDNKYYEKLPKGSKDVIITEVEATINPRETEKRFFITAATNKDEKNIHKILTQTSQYYVNRFTKRV